MQQQFGNNRRRYFGKDPGFHRAHSCRRKQFWELCGTTPATFTVEWQSDLHRWRFLPCFWLEHKPSLQHLANHPRAFVCLALTYVWSRFRPTACQNCSTTVAMKTAITGLVFWEVRRELCACVAWIHPYLGLCPLTVYRDLQWHVILI